MHVQIPGYSDAKLYDIYCLVLSSIHIMYSVVSAHSPAEAVISPCNLLLMNSKSIMQLLVDTFTFVDCCL